MRPRDLDAFVEERFDVRELRPFGLRLSPKEGDILPESWFASDPARVSALIRRESLLVIDGCRRFGGETTEIASSRRSSSVSVFHSDNQGQPFALAWQSEGSRRNDTAFIRPRDMVPAMLDNTKPLSESVADLSSAFAVQLRSILECGERINPNDFHTLYRSVFRYRELGRICLGHEGIVERFLNRYSSKARTRKLEMQRSDEEANIVFDSLGAFFDSVNESVQDRSFSHSWQDHPSATVVACNRYEADRPVESWDCAFHRGVPDSAPVSTDRLARCAYPEEDMERGGFIPPS